MTHRQVNLSGEKNQSNGDKNAQRTWENREKGHNQK